MSNLDESELPLPGDPLNSRAHPTAPAGSRSLPLWRPPVLTRIPIKVTLLQSGNGSDGGCVASSDC